MKRISMWAVVALVLTACQKDLSGDTLTGADFPSAAKAAPSTSSNTEQSIMVDITSQRNFVKSGNEFWEYNQEAVATSLALADGKVYSELSQPEKNEYDRLASAQKCEDWALEGHPNWTLRKTAGEGGSGETALDINFIIAAESAVKNSKKDLTKYSFSLNGRVSDLKVDVVEAATGASVWTSGQMSLVEGTNYEIVGGAAYGSIPYKANGYTTPNPVLLINDGSTLAQIIAKNGYGDANVTESNTQIVRLLAPIATGDLDLSEGSYLVKVTGVIKGNAADAAGVPFAVRGGGIIIAPSCGQPQQQ